MLCVASTIKDDLSNVRWYVEQNLANSVDHLIIFLDAPTEPSQQAVAEYLEQHHHVTLVLADDAWWMGDRPQKLNVRQCINANVAKYALSQLTSCDWLFHLDGDEILQVDRHVLDGLDRGIEAVQLEPLESVSTASGPERPVWFKRPLLEAELELLQVLGVIGQPTNRDYFHGHLQGKAGVRPAAKVWLTLHRAVDKSRKAVAPFRHAHLQHLHYESHSADEFIRKWTALVGSGPSASFRPGRARTARALWALIGKDLPQETLEKMLLRIYERTTEDDVETLRDLDLLVNRDPTKGDHVPQPFADSELDRMSTRMEKLRREPKGEFFHGTAPAKSDQ